MGLPWTSRLYGLVALRYDEVRDLLRDKRLRQGIYAWPQQNGIHEGLLAEWWAENVISKEGDDHRRLRRLAFPVFTPQAVEALVPGFRRVAEELLDEFAAQGECEFVADFATPFSARVLLQLIGLPEGHWEQLARLATDMGESFGVDVARKLPQIEAALQGLYDFADEAIAARRNNLGDDTVSQLVAARDGQDKLSESELRALIVTILFAGMDTTRNQLGLAMLTFLDHPDQWQLLASQPELAAAAVEEVMRVNPSVLWITREAMEEITVGGLSVPKGTTIHLLPESAGTDPRIFGQDGFDITVDRPRQLGFGAGPHHCLGHFFARADMREALPILARRLRNPRLTDKVKFRPESGLTGPLEVPMSFDAVAAPIT